MEIENKTKKGEERQVWHWSEQSVNGSVTSCTKSMFGQTAYFL